MSAETPIYRRCTECGKEWTAEALLRAANALMTDAGLPWMSSARAVLCCPECSHGW